MKHNHTSVIVRIILWTLTALILLGVLLCGMGVLPGLSIRGFSFGGWNFHYSDSAKYEVGNGSVPASNLHSVEINWVDGSVNVTVTDGDSVVFRESSGLEESEQLRYRVAGDRLIIQYCKPQWSFGFFDSPKKDLTVEIPRSLAEQLLELQIDTVSAPVTAQDLTAQSCEVDGVSGNITFTNCSFSELDVDTVSGSLQLSGEAHRVNFDGVSGGMTLDLLVAPQKISTDTISGSICLNLPQDAAFSVELDSVSGKLDNEFPSTQRGDLYYCGQGGGAYQFDTVSGDVIIRATVTAPAPRS